MAVLKKYFFTIRMRFEIIVAYILSSCTVNKKKYIRNTIYELVIYKPNDINCLGKYYHCWVAYRTVYIRKLLFFVPTLINLWNVGDMNTSKYFSYNKWFYQLYLVCSLKNIWRNSCFDYKWFPILFCWKRIKIFNSI